MSAWSAASLVVARAQPRIPAKSVASRAPAIVHRCGTCGACQPKLAEEGDSPEAIEGWRRR
jgi:hypothetical protein